ncbi:MSCRAMM family protein [Methanopyrus kandleri]
MYNDSDAYSEDQVKAYEDFLTWCEENGVKVAVFHYPECEFEAPGITAVIREHLGKSVEFVGSHGTAHSIAGLPPEIERLQIEYSWEFFKEQNLEPGLRRDVVSPSIEWVIDENFVHVCRELGIKWIVSGYRTWEFNPEKVVSWQGEDMDYLADVLIVKKLDIDGDVVYVCPVIDFGELVDDVEQDIGPYGLESLKGAFRRAVETLLNVGAIKGNNDGKADLVLWVLIHPWQLVEEMGSTGRTGLDLIEEFIRWVKSGSLDFTLYGVIPVHFELEEPSKCLELVREIAENPDAYGHPDVTISDLDWTSMVHASDLRTVEELKKKYPEIVKLWREGMDVLKSIAPRLQRLKRTELDPLVRDVVLRTVNGAQLGCMCESEGIIQYLEVWKAELELLRDYLDGSASLLTASTDDNHRVLVFQYSDGGIAAVFLDRNWWCPSLGVVRGKVTLDRADPTDLVVRGEFTSVGLSDITGGRIVVEDEKGDVIAEVPFTLDELESGVTISLPKDRRADTVYVVLSGNVQGRLWDQFQVDLSLPIPVPRASVSGTLSLVEKTPEGATLEVRYETHTVACTPERLVITLYDQSGEIVSQETIEYPPETGSVRFKVTGSGSYRAVLVLQCSSGLTTESVASELSTDVMEIVLPSVRIRASTDVQPGPEGATLRVDYDVDASHAEVDGVEVVLYDEDGYVVGKKEVSDLSGSVTFDVDKDGTYKVLITARCRDADTGTQFSTTTETGVTVQIPRASVNGALSLVKKTPENAVLSAYY